MGQQILLIIAAIIFYFLGRYSMGSYEIENALKKVKKILKPGKKGMLIDYPTAEEQVYSGSEQEKIDKQQEKLIKEQLKL